MTRPMKRKPSLMLLLVVALLALAPLLAALQYRWLGQVSEGERERMKNNLNATAKQFCQDFDGELTAIYMLFQPAFAPFSDPINRVSQAQDDFPARYKRWRETSAHPRLVKAIYQTQAGEGDGRLARFNAETGVFETCEWPDSLSKLRKFLDESRARHESLRLMLHKSFGTGEQKIFERKVGASDGSVTKMVVQLGLGSVDEDLPGLIIPISDHNQEEIIPIPNPRSYRIVALDADYIRRELIPELVRRHFGDAGAGEYKIAVMKRGRTEDRAGEMIYRSDNSISEASLAEGDLTADLFKVRINEANKIFFRQLPQRSNGGPVAESRRQIAIRVESNVKIKEGENAPTPTAILAPRIPEEVSQSLFSHNGEGAWRLVIKHRAGSLEAAVTNARRRNLAISFGILLLLGASVGFIVLSSRRAERLAKQQMEFVAGVSHELRTPLAVICSAAENLADGVIDNREQIKRYGGLIRDEGRRLTGMVEQVLEFAGAQSGRKTYEMKPTDLSQIIEDAITACHLQLVEGGFEIERKIAANLPMVKADAAALSRAIQNLLSNAMKYSGDSRWIGLSAEVIETANGEQVQIEVSDRGLGVAPSEIGRIFEPFYRGKEAAAAQIHGNGLGLSLVKHIVEAHGGRVNVKSGLGQGSHFAVVLPPSAEFPPHQSERKSDGNNESSHPDCHDRLPHLCER
ncbi:MAG: Adaptive-response sensory-kinase SasA [Acidobacteria bacterium]|nr:Adaptive-response sensory-kinase SasA [Acidobacteriota bacterium]